MRDRRHVLDRAHVESGGSKGTDSRLASGTRSAHHHVNTAHAMVTRLVGCVGSRLLRGERCALARSTEAQRTRTLPRHRVPTGIGDGDNGVVERSLHMHQSVRNVLELLLFELFAGLALLLRCGTCCLSHVLCLRRRFLLIRYRALARTLAGAGVGVGALSANRKAAAMTEPTI